jgi:hypothetical protein
MLPCSATPVQGTGRSAGAGVIVQHDAACPALYVPCVTARLGYLQGGVAEGCGQPLAGNWLPTASVGTCSSCSHVSQKHRYRTRPSVMRAPATQHHNSTRLPVCHAGPRGGAAADQPDGAAGQGAGAEREAGAGAGQPAAPDPGAAAAHRAPGRRCCPALLHTLCPPCKHTLCTPPRTTIVSADYAEHKYSSSAWSARRASPGRRGRQTPWAVYGPWTRASQLLL